jgi:hypothetical protein
LTLSAPNEGFRFVEPSIGERNMGESVQYCDHGFMISSTELLPYR